MTEREVEPAPEWITWQQAAELVGCPVPTIDWWKRQGRIRSRHGRWPSLDRASVQEFAVWWQQREEGSERRRRRRRASRTPSPDPAEWATTAEAAELLGITTGQVGHLARTGQLEGQLVGGRRWISRDVLRRAIASRAAERQTWVSWADAAKVAGCSVETIHRAVQAGRIERRDQPGTALPSLRRDSVEAFTRQREAEAEAAARARQEAARSRGGAPPDLDHVWLPTAVVAIMLRLSPSGVRQRAARGYLPCERHGGRLWFRRDHIELVAAARFAAL
ncbi:type IV toxin-antitoxin system AbiEi family antitoxin domain-containing protein [Nocardioides litoris]|uniref:type IV toxin-antitoxin system AbiEi family antitoxin domain-containing protein n=1 Tax=Nocardioides litoris TaxID=1926648 RepID=UPI001121DDDF|nr:type IV toxin-antitoxin system AbiEi family antitoxin domain-containing protein [Nocardioides litoris]